SSGYLRPLRPTTMAPDHSRSLPITGLSARSLGVRLQIRDRFLDFGPRRLAVFSEIGDRTVVLLRERDVLCAVRSLRGTDEGTKPAGRDLEYVFVRLERFNRLSIIHEYAAEVLTFSTGTAQDDYG